MAIEHQNAYLVLTKVILPVLRGFNISTSETLGTTLIVFMNCRPKKCILEELGKKMSVCISP